MRFPGASARLDPARAATLGPSAAGSGALAAPRAARRGPYVLQRVLVQLVDLSWLLVQRVAAADVGA